MNRKEEDMYDVSTYSTSELYDLLDLNNPSDRELEAKIIFLYRKYKNMQNQSGDQLAKFFLDIYNHFFDTEEEQDEQEEIETINEEEETIKEGMVNLTDIKKEEAKNNDNTKYKNFSTSLPVDKKIIEFNTKDTIAEIKGNTKGDVVGNVDNVLKTTGVQYVKDQLDPVYQETVTRIVTIDSQYRTDKRTLSTDYTFNLSEEVQNVISVSLYSAQIPYAWYTIPKSFGSNFFYIKGNTNGINNGNHDILIDISAGNYDPITLTNAVNTSIKVKQKVYTDISFGITNISYSPSTLVATFTFDLTNRYSENSYYLDFPGWTTPNIIDLSGNLNDTARAESSLSSFLGFNNQQYFFNTLNSGNFSQVDLVQNDNNAIRLDPLSATINIIKYIPTINNDTGEVNTFNPATSIIDMVIPITLTLKTTGAKYSRNQIIYDLSNQIHKNQYLSNESYIKLVNVTNIEDVRYGFSYYQIKLKPSRYTTNNIANSKFFLQFPNESNIASINNKIWTGASSVLRFQDISNELQNITGETQIVKQTEVYTVSTGPYILLRCVNPNFISSVNDVSFSLQSNLTNNTDIYTVSQLVDSINAGIINSTINNPVLQGPDPIIGYSYVETPGDPPNYTFAYIDSNYVFSLAIDVEKSYNNSNYVLDFTDTSFNSLFNLGTVNGSFSTNSELTNNISTRSPTDRFIITNGSVLFKVYPLQNNKGNERDMIGAILYNGPTTSFYNYKTLSNTLTSYLINYTYGGIRIFTNESSFSITNVTATSITINLNLYITRNILPKDYSIIVVDNANQVNVWNNPLNISTTFNAFYNLNLSSNYLITYTNSNAITIKGIKPIDRVTIDFTSIPNTFYFRAYEDGVYSATSDNDIAITIPITDSNGIILYTRDLLISTINTLIQYTRAAGTYFYLTGPDSNNNYHINVRTTINRFYTAADYRLVFYDTYSFVKCFVGATSVQNTSWDSTLGYILGFRNSAYYNLSELSNSPNIISITGDSAVTCSLYNYLLLTLDDFVLNRLNDGIITITGKDTSIPLPSYASRSNFQCNPVTKLLTYNTLIGTNNAQLTQKQLYSVGQIANNKNSVTSNLSIGSASNTYAKGVFTEDVFAFIALKTAGVTNGATIIVDGGTLQNNERKYFGPAKIRRMRVKLITDKGDTIDLNGSNWSFSLSFKTLHKTSTG